MTAPTLETLGWTPAWAEAFAPHREAGLVPARVTLEHNYIFRVLADDGEHLAEAAGRLKHRAEGRAELPVVGDCVAVRPGDPASRAQIPPCFPAWRLQRRLQTAKRKSKWWRPMSTAF